MKRKKPQTRAVYGGVLLSGGDVSYRDANQSAPTISGVAAVFYQRGNPGTQYRLNHETFERISPTAFDAAMSRPDDAVATFNHDSSRVLGRVSAGTLRLSISARGLEYVNNPPNQSWAQDLVDSIRRGDIIGSSFSFIPERTRWTREDGFDIRWIESVTLLDVSPVTHAAYTATAASVRVGGAPSRRAGVPDYITAHARAIEVDGILDHPDVIVAGARADAGWR